MGRREEAREHAQVEQQRARCSYQLATAMSYGDAVSMALFGGELVEGRVTHCHAQPTLVYVVGGQPVRIERVKSVGAAR